MAMRISGDSTMRFPFVAIIGLARWITIGDALLHRSKPQKGHAKRAHVQDYGISTSPTSSNYEWSWQRFGRHPWRG